MTRHIILVVALLSLQTALTSAATYHLDPAGNDRSSGLSPETAWATLGKVNGVSLRSGDKVLLKRGGVFKGQLVIRNAAGTKDQPIVVDAYGDGAAPIIDASTVPAGIHVVSSSFVEVSNIEISCDGGTAGINHSGRCGVRLMAEGQGECRSIVLRSLFIHDVFNKSPGGAIGIEIDRSDEATLQDLRIEQCRIERTAFHGMRIKRVRGLRIIDNRLADIGGPGIVPHQSQDVVIQGNTVDRSGANADPRMAGRGSGAWCLGCTNVLVERNQFLHARGILDSCGFHVDIGNKNVIVQYNHSVDNAGGFVQILGRNQNVAYRYNISVNDGWRQKGVDGAIGDGHVLMVSGFNVAGKPNPVGIGPANTYIYNNTIYVKKELPAMFSIAQTTDGLLIANNIFHILGPAKHVLSGWDQKHAPPQAKIGRVVFTHNLYLHEGAFPNDAPVRDSRTLTGDPGFIRPGGLEPGDYRPSGAAAVKDKGVAIAELAGDEIGLKIGLKVDRDFFGNPIEGLPDLGAAELRTRP